MNQNIRESKKVLQALKDLLANKIGASTVYFCPVCDNGTFFPNKHDCIIHILEDHKPKEIFEIVD